jgi:DNA-directed RNA polymerase specialized sigma24 family protein
VSGIETHTAYLQALCYRMTGSATDSDDLVQETFLRALESPPPETTRRWLTELALSMAADVLAKRKSTPYPGPWLPEPMITEPPPADAPAGPRIGLVESGTFAFLLAAEALTTEQRAAILLHDVFDEDVEKDAIDQARAALAPYFAARTIPTAALAERNQRALAILLAAIERNDVPAATDALADDAVALVDGGGRVKAALGALHGAEIAKLVLSEQKALWVNGLPAVVCAFGDRAALVRCDSDGDARVRALHVVANPLKLARLRV